MPRSKRLDDWIQNRTDSIESMLLDWAQTAFDEDENASTDIARSYLEANNFDDVEIVTAPGCAPAVFGHQRRAGADAATVLVVGLHDAPWLDGENPDSVGRNEQGVTGPGIAGRFAPLVSWVEAYLGLTDENNGDPRVNIAVLAIDSASLGTNQIPDIVRASAIDPVDVVVCTSAVAWDMSAPTVTLASRGELLVEVIVSTGRDLSLNAFGGAARNPLNHLVQLLSQLRDQSGRIALPGFYSRATPPTSAEREALSRNGYDPARWLRGTGAAALAGGPPPIERASAWPTVEVVSINAGAGHRLRSQTMPGTASGLLSFALVPDQRPEEVEAALHNWLDTRATNGVDASLNVIARSAPYQVERDTPWVICQARAAKRVFNEPPIPVLGGGMSGMAEIATALGRPMLFSGLSSPAGFVDTEHERLSRERFRLGTNLAAETLEQFVRRAART